MAITFVSRIATPVALNAPPFVTPAQSHTAGNLLVVVLTHFDNLPALPYVVGSVTNTAGDTFYPSAQTPFREDQHIPPLYGDTHTLEVWYCPITAGNPADVITVHVTPVNQTTYFSMACYEFSIGPLQSLRYSGLDAGVAYNFLYPTFVSLTVVVSTPAIPIAQPSVLVAIYRNSAGVTPTNPSGIQFTTDGGGAMWDSYQLVSGPSVCTATMSGASGPQGGLFAAAFSMGGPPGCFEDLPHAASSGGSGCASDVSNV